MEEDRHTRRALDELADLFLTDATVNDERSQTDSSGAAHETEALEQELVGPDPVRLTPKLPPHAESAFPPSPDEPADPTDHPHLRLHRDPDAPAAAVAPDPLDSAVRSAIRRGQGRSSRTGSDQAEPLDTEVAQSVPVQLVVEAVLMGNLPGLSGPWLTQYGQLLAQHLGPVVMLHVDDRSIDAELIEPTDRPQRGGRVPPGASGVAPSAGSRGDLIDRLESLIQPGPAQVQAIIVHSEASPRPEAVRRLAALDRWTLLCGADDAAVIAGYRLIKSLVEADADAVAKQVGVMIVGSDYEAGQAAAQKLGATTRSLLDEPVSFVGSQRQMVPVNLRQLGRFGPTEQLWPRLASWLDKIEPVAPAFDGPLTISERDTVVNPPDLEESEPPDAEAESDAEAAAADLGDMDWSWLREPGSKPAPEAPEAPEPAAEPSSPEVSEESTHGHGADAPDAEPNLAQFLISGEGQIAGGIALEARCPNQPRTQLVLDQRGRLHLLRRHSSEERGDPNALRSAIVDLLEARKWVLQHIELLQLTQRQCRFDTAAEPTLHLFTDRADLAAALVARLGDTLHLHLLKQVRVGEQSTWFCTPMQS